MEVKILTKISRKISSYHTIDMERESCRSKGSHPCEARILSRTYYLHNTEDSIDDLATLCSSHQFN